MEVDFASRPLIRPLAPWWLKRARSNDKIQWVMSCGSRAPGSTSELVTIIRISFLEGLCAPVRLWDDCVMLQADIMSLTFQPGRPWNEDRVPTSATHGGTQDISPHVEFEWRQPAWAWCPRQPSADHRVMARWLRPTTDFGMMLTHRLVTEGASFTHRSPVQPVTGGGLRQDEAQDRTKRVDEKIRAIMLAAYRGQVDFVRFVARRCTGSIPR